MLNRCLVVGCRRMVRGRARRRCPRARRRYPRLLLRSVFSCTLFSEKRRKRESLTLFALVLHFLKIPGEWRRREN